MNLFNNLEKKHYFLLAGWLLINITQAFFTNLHADEAYYWLYSKQLSWGFFDHPPMVAFLIFIGDSIMHNELGVRLLIMLLSTVTLAMIMNELNEKKDLFFLSLFIISFPLVHTHIGGFLALPDTPLVFFTLLFYLVYRKFITEPNLKIALLLAAIAAAMIYSKYHAFAALGLIVLSNLKLLKNKYFWVIAFGTLLLLIPHILWQFENDFPTFRYHLFERSNSFQLGLVFNNISSQLLVAGPLSCILVLYSLKKFKIKKDPFRRAIIFSLLGFQILFFVMSFWNRIEGHWTSLITPLLMIATYPIISKNLLLKKWFIRLSLPIVVLIFMFRFYMAADFIPNVGLTKIAFYNHQKTANDVKEMAEGKKVASFDRFGFIGNYTFYTGDPIIHLATPGYRFCQFDLWDDETAGEGDPLFIVMPEGLGSTNLVTLKNGRTANTTITPKFQSLKHLYIANNNLIIKNNSLSLSITASNKFEHPIIFEHPSVPAIGFMQKGIEISTTPLLQITKKKEILKGEEIIFIYDIPLSLIDTTQAIVIFTQTIERNRGDMISLNPLDLVGK